MNTNQNKSYFKTSSFNLAVFLMVKNIQLIAIERGLGNRSAFVFSESPERKSFTNIFNFASENDPETLCDARGVMSAIKNLKDKLYQQ